MSVTLAVFSSTVTGTGSLTSSACICGYVINGVSAMAATRVHYYSLETSVV